MKKAELIHSVLLVSITIGLLFWTANPSLRLYSVQLSALLVVLVILGKHRLNQPTYSLLASCSLTIIITLVIDATGAIESPLFFLNYVLLFILSLLLEPIIPLVLSGALGLLYLFSTIPQSPISLISLLAFPAITPLAYFTGQMYQKITNQKKEIKRLSKEVEFLEQELIEEEVEHIKP